MVEQGSGAKAIGELLVGEAGGKCFRPVSYTHLDVYKRQYLFNLLSVPVGIVIWTVVIVFCLRGPVNKLEKLGVPRLAGTAIAYVLMFVVLALVGLLMFSPAFGVGDQFTNLIQSVPGYIQTIANWRCV